MLNALFSRLKVVLHLCNPTNNMKDLLSLYAEIGSSLDRGVSIRLDNPAPNRKYLFIGNDSIISGQFIFESKSGKITIGDHSYVGGGMFISRSSITIGNYVTIAWGGTFYDHNSHSLYYLDRRKDI